MGDAPARRSRCEASGPLMQEGIATGPVEFPARTLLGVVRGAIDAVDDGAVILLAARRRLVQTAALLKRRAQMPLRDRMREREVAHRAHRLGRRLEVPDAAVRQLLELLIGEARRQQGIAADLDQGGAPPDERMIALAMTFAARNEMSLPERVLLRLVPPPRRAAPLLRLVPRSFQARLLEQAMASVFEACASDGSLDFMDGRRLGIEIVDLGLRWVVERGEGRVRVTDAPPEACVRGTAVDMLLLAGRLEDADTLFFQRRLTLTGDTELGLTARNLLERLPWESVPLALRIVLNRGARLARAARAAHRGEA